jgi:hypothetical protein
MSNDTVYTDHQEHLAVNVLKAMGYTLIPPAIKSIDNVEEGDVCYVLQELTMASSVLQTNWRSNMSQVNSKHNQQMLMDSSQVDTTLAHLNLTRKLLCVSYQMQPDDLPDTSEFIYEVYQGPTGKWASCRMQGRGTWKARIPRRIGKDAAAAMVKYMNGDKNG